MFLAGSGHLLTQSAQTHSRIWKRSTQEAAPCPTQSHYSEPEPTCRCPILILPSASLGCDKNICISHCFIMTMEGCARISGSRALACKVGITHLSLHGECICDLGYSPFQPMVHNWYIKYWYMWSCMLESPLLLIGISNLCADSGFPVKKYVIMTICLTSNSR